MKSSEETQPNENSSSSSSSKNKSSKKDSSFSSNYSESSSSSSFSSAASTSHSSDEVTSISKSKGKKKDSTLSDTSGGSSSIYTKRKSSLGSSITTSKETSSSKSKDKTKTSKAGENGNVTDSGAVGAHLEVVTDERVSRSGSKKRNKGGLVHSSPKSERNGSGNVDTGGEGTGNVGGKRPGTAKGSGTSSGHGEGAVSGSGAGHSGGAASSKAGVNKLDSGTRQVGGTASGGFNSSIQGSFSGQTGDEGSGNSGPSGSGNIQRLGTGHGGGTYSDDTTAIGTTHESGAENVGGTSFGDAAVSSSHQSSDASRGGGMASGGVSVSANGHIRNSGSNQSGGDGSGEDETAFSGEIRDSGTAGDNIKGSGTDASGDTAITSNQKGGSGFSADVDSNEQEDFTGSSGGASKASVSSSASSSSHTSSTLASSGLSASQVSGHKPFSYSTSGGANGNTRTSAGHESYEDSSDEKDEMLSQESEEKINATGTFDADYRFQDDSSGFSLSTGNLTAEEMSSISAMTKAGFTFNAALGGWSNGSGVVVIHKKIVRIVKTTEVLTYRVEVHRNQSMQLGRGIQRESQYHKECKPEIMHFSAFAQRCLSERRSTCRGNKSTSSPAETDNTVRVPRSFCTDLPNKVYAHPNSPSKFISCHGQPTWSEGHCPHCNKDATSCPDGHLVFNPNLQECVWADEALLTGINRPSATRAKLQLREDSAMYQKCEDNGDGNYAHPISCRKYVSCQGDVILERICPSCKSDPVKCPRGNLLFSEKDDACLPADEVGWCVDKLSQSANNDDNE